jgi:hypothetical protein
MAKLSKTTETIVKSVYTLTLTEFEAQCLKTLLGEVCGKGRAVEAMGSVWKVLYDEGINDAPIEIDRSFVNLYIQDKD